MVESGEFDKIKRKWSPPEQECGGGKGRPLGFENTSPAFLVYLAGLVISWFVFFLEILKGREKTKKSLGSNKQLGHDRRARKMFDYQEN